MMGAVLEMKPPRSGSTLLTIEGKPPQHQTKKHKREDVLRQCQVLAIYFGGEWWCARHPPRQLYKNDKDD